MIIVTGGAGFIGSNLVKALNNLGHKNLIIIDNIENNELKKRNLINCSYVEYYNKKEFIQNIKKRKFSINVDFVFHLGACSSTTNFDIEYLNENNLEYSKELLNWCNKNRIPIIYASSASIYGRNIKAVKEEDNYNPMNPYANSKMLFDKYVISNFENFDIPIIGLRYFNVYGKNESHKTNMTSPVFKFWEQLKLNGEINIFEAFDGYADGEHSRDFISVNDCVDINLFFFKKPQSGIFNVGTGNSFSFNFVANTIIDFYKYGKINYVKFPDKLKKSYQPYTKADITKLKNSGYQSKFTILKNGIYDYMNYLDSSLI